MEGRSSRVMLRITLTLASASCLMESTWRRTSAESGGTCAAALPASISSAESDWPTSSCSSREIARRSSSWAETSRAESSCSSCRGARRLPGSAAPVPLPGAACAATVNAASSTPTTRVSGQHQNQPQPQQVEGAIQLGRPRPSSGARSSDRCDPPDPGCLRAAAPLRDSDNRRPARGGPSPGWCARKSSSLQ